MYSKLKPFSLMGVSNIPEMFLSEKDLSNAMEFSTTTTTTFLVRPPLQFQQVEQCQTAPNFQQEERLAEEEEEEEKEHDHHQQQQQQEQVQEADQCKLATTSPPPPPPQSEDGNNNNNNGGHEDEETAMDDGFKTPTSSDQKIQAMLKCPPAPRKPKTLPSAKRKALGRRILLDLTKEIESLFPPSLLADLGNKIKKVRQGSDFQ